LGIRINEDALVRGKITFVVSANSKTVFLNMKEVEITSVDASYWTQRTYA